MPAGLLACDVWRLLSLRGIARYRRAALAVLLLQHLHKLAGLRQLAPTPTLLSELRHSVMSNDWLLRAAGFWNSLEASSGMPRQLALNAGQLAVDGVCSGCVAGLVACLRAGGYEIILAAGSLPGSDVTQLCHRMRTHGDEVLCTNYSWYQPCAPAAMILRLPLSHTALRQLPLFKIRRHGHAMDVNNCSGTARAKRCTLCGACPGAASCMQVCKC